MRIRISEITIGRIADGLKRRISNIPHWLTWQMAKNQHERLAEIKNRHKGERCFLIANGPSLKKIDLTLIKDEITVGMNRIYLLFNENFSTTYCTVINELVIDEFHEDLDALKSETFVNWTKRSLFKNQSQRYFYVQNALEDGFSCDLSKGVYSGGTVTYASLQLAYHMGFDEVIIVGLDHSFADKGTPNKTEIRTGTDTNHFHPEYFPKGIKWQLPDLYRSELAYAKARSMFEADGRRILDATIDGKCDVFEKIEYASLFEVKE